MVKLNLLLFLVGNRSAISNVLARRSSGLVGLMFAVNAGLALSYDRVYLPRHPLWVFIPLLAPFPIAGLLWFSCGRSRVMVRADSHTERLRFSAVLFAVWMVLPVMALAGLPVHRLMNPYDAERIRPLLVFFLGIWQVALVIRLLSVIANTGYVVAAARILPWVCLIVIMAAAIPAYLNVNLPGRMRVNDEEGWRILVEGAVLLAAIILLPVMITIAFVDRSAMYWRAPVTIEEQTSSGRSHRAGLLALTMLMAVWVVALPVSQREQRLKDEVLERFKTGRMQDALELMAAHSKSEFPPTWHPPPRLLFTGATPGILDVMECLVERDIHGWVRAEYIPEFQRYIGSSLTFNPDYFPADRGKVDLRRTTAVLERMPEGPFIVREHVSVIKLLMEERGRDLTSEERELLGRWIEIGRSAK